MPLPTLSRCLLQHSSFSISSVVADGTTKHFPSAATRLLNQRCITRSLGGATVLHDVNNNSRFRYGFYANRIQEINKIQHNWNNNYGGQIRRHVGSSSFHGEHHRGSRGRGKKLNEFGHDYTKIGGAIDKSVCTLSETEINNLIRARNEFIRKREFHQANKIHDELRQHGVVIRDEAKAWRADGVSSFPIELSARNTKNMNKVPRMVDCDTLDDAIKAMHDNLDKVSPRDLSAFWTVVPKFLWLISNTVWAFEKVKVSHPDLFEKVGNYITSLDHLGGFDPQNFSNILIAFAKAEVSHPALFKKVGNHITSLDDIGGFKPQAVANIVWAFAKAEVSHPELFKKVGEHITSLDHLGEFRHRSFPTLCGHLQKLKYHIWICFAKLEIISLLLIILRDLIRKSLPIQYGHLQNLS